MLGFYVLVGTQVFSLNPHRVIHKLSTKVLIGPNYAQNPKIDKFTYKKPSTYKALGTLDVLEYGYT